MTDHEKWDTAVAAVAVEFGNLPPTAKDQLLPLLQRVRGLKKEIHRYADLLDGSAICAGCGGQCCATGKHHFTAIDLLVYLAEGKPLVVPEYSSGLCPFLGSQGCMMEPEYRPYNCVTFNCERIDALLDASERDECMDVERKLRASCRAVEELFDNTFMQGLIITCERDLLRDRVPVLRFREASATGRLSEEL